jgi:hypothetical protein
MTVDRAQRPWQKDLVRSTTRIRMIEGALLPLVLCASAPSDVDKSETIAVSVRSFACAGLCPRYDVSVTPDGQVTSRWVGIRVETLRFRVSAVEAARFRSILHSLRAAAVPRARTICAGAIGPLQPWQSMGKQSVSIMLLRNPAVQIAWRGPGASEPLVVCDVTPNAPGASIEEALGNVHLSPMGGRLDEREWIRCHHHWTC